MSLSSRLAGLSSQVPGGPRRACARAESHRLRAPTALVVFLPGARPPGFCSRLPSVVCAASVSAGRGGELRLAARLLQARQVQNGGRPLSLLGGDSQEPAATSAQAEVSGAEEAARLRKEHSLQALRLSSLQSETNR
jgi:hypothetical protein